MRTIYRGARVYVSKRRYAEAILVDGEKIRAVGSDEAIMEMSKAGDEIVDCRGCSIVPGLVDTHLHMIMLGETMRRPSIFGARSKADLVERCTAFAKRSPELVDRAIIAMGWNQDLFDDGHELPDRHLLDQIANDRPVMLSRVCGHVAAANTRLVEMIEASLAGARYPDDEMPIGEDGIPTGVLRERAVSAAEKIVRDAMRDDARDLLTTAIAHAASMGITGVQSNDAGSSTDDADRIFSLVRGVYSGEERGLIRYRHQVCFKSPDDFRASVESGEYSRRDELYPSTSRLSLGPLKLFKDGSLGGRTAMMRGGYAGSPDERGILVLDDETVDDFFRVAEQARVQVVVHAIGDGAIGSVIDAIERATDGSNGLRHGINHCQITDGDLIDRIVADDILVFAQPIFIDSDMKIVESLCGRELASTSYAFGTLIRRGAHLSYGTDAPVEGCDPFLNIYEAVTRKDRNGAPAEGFFAGERVDVETAIDAYTAASAYAEFAEHRRGRIAPGMDADLTIVDRDIFEIPPDEIKDARAAATIVAGERIFEA